MHAPPVRRRTWRRIQSLHIVSHTHEDKHTRYLAHYSAFELRNTYVYAIMCRRDYISSLSVLDRFEAYSKQELGRLLRKRITTSALCQLGFAHQLGFYSTPKSLKRLRQMAELEVRRRRAASRARYELQEATMRLQCLNTLQTIAQIDWLSASRVDRLSQNKE